MTLVDKIIACRKYRGMSRVETCERLSISMAKLKRYERMVFSDKNGVWRGKCDFHLVKEPDDNVASAFLT